jgi:hypothetical protein
MGWINLAQDRDMKIFLKIKLCTLTTHWGVEI